MLLPPALTCGRWFVGSTWVDSSGGGCTVNGASRTDGSWSQTFKQNSEFGAQWWNGVIWKLSVSGNGLEGRPQAI